MSNFFKHIFPWQVILTITYLIYIFLNNNWYNFLLGAIPAVFLIFKIYYDKSKYVFIYCRKIYAWWKNPGVHWSCSYNYELDTDVDFPQLSRKFINELRNSRYNLRDIDNKDCRLLLTINDCRLDIYYNDVENEITIEYSSNISYRDSIKVFNDEFLVYKSIFEDLTSNKNKRIYSILLKFTEHNPFYSLYIKNYADIKIDKFQLNYSTSDLIIEISENIMFIKSSNENSITDALKNYLIVSE